MEIARRMFYAGSHGSNLRRWTWGCDAGKNGVVSDEFAFGISTIALTSAEIANSNRYA